LRLALTTLVIFLAGCSGGGIAGTYKSGTSLREIVLRSDGTYRMMLGERTSPMDASGTYRQEGDTVVFTANPPNQGLANPKTAKITDEGLSVGVERFHKT